MLALSNFTKGWVLPSLESKREEQLLEAAFSGSFFRNSLEGVFRLESLFLYFNADYFSSVDD